MVRTPERKETRHIAQQAHPIIGPVVNQLIKVPEERRHEVMVAQPFQNGECWIADDSPSSSPNPTLMT